MGKRKKSISIQFEIFLKVSRWKNNFKKLFVKFSFQDLWSEYSKNKVKQTEDRQIFEINEISFLIDEMSWKANRTLSIYINLLRFVSKEGGSVYLNVVFSSIPFLNNIQSVLTTEIKAIGRLCKYKASSCILCPVLNVQCTVNVWQIWVSVFYIIY